MVEELSKNDTSAMEEIYRYFYRILLRLTSSANPS